MPGKSSPKYSTGFRGGTTRSGGSPGAGNGGRKAAGLPARLRLFEDLLDHSLHDRAAGIVDVAARQGIVPAATGAELAVDALQELLLLPRLQAGGIDPRQVGEVIRDRHDGGRVGRSGNALDRAGCLLGGVLRLDRLLRGRGLTGQRRRLGGGTGGRRRRLRGRALRLEARRRLVRA